MQPNFLNARPSVGEGDYEETQTACEFTCWSSACAFFRSSASHPDGDVL